jgi:hypothetical protein
VIHLLDIVERQILVGNNFIQCGDVHHLLDVVERQILVGNNLIKVGRVGSYTKPEHYNM